jgi:predicted phage baseplate assembly protein
MTRLPEIQLDDRRFQDLVSEARMRIARTCPEWTEHNVSDPGVTLIELFAWMTEMTIYRLNRVPDKLHVALLDLLGIRLDGPSAARTGLRFRLAGPALAPVTISGGTTEVGTLRTATDEAIVFQVDEDFTIPAARPTAYVLARGGAVKDVGLAQGVARPQGDDRLAFGSPPAIGDAMCVGFDDPLARLVVEVEIEASHARGTGVDPEDPPLEWEVSQPGGGWAACEVLEDLTGGFNLGSGTVLLQLPPASGVASLAGERRHWLRCRITERTRSGATGATYAHAPEVYALTAAPVGALLPATHAAQVREEVLGVSDGTPGQVFPLRYTPILKLEAHETLEVQESGTRGWTAWEARDSFAGSRPTDAHFVLDRVSGELELGPAIREANGGWTQAGAIPPKGAVLRFSAYRHGGGRSGNVAARTLNVLRTPVAGVDRVTNPIAAVGGVDAEALEHARRRAGMEIRSRSRAVTAEDFEYLAEEASPRVARAVCLAPVGGGPVRLHLLPQAADPDRRLAYEELLPDEALLAEVAEYLEERRLIGTTVELLPCRFRGLSVVVSLQAAPQADLSRVQEDAAHALYTYLNPLVGGSARGPGSGWPFGRPLNQGELFGVVHAVEGVEFVRLLRLYETDLATGEQSPNPAGTHVLLEPDELVASAEHIVKAAYRDT